MVGARLDVTRGCGKLADCAHRGIVIAALGRSSLQVVAFCFGLLKDGNVGVSVFPQCEEVLIGGSGIGRVGLQCIRAGEAEMCECSDRLVDYDPAMIEDFLEFGGFAQDDRSYRAANGLPRTAV